MSIAPVLSVKKLCVALSDQSILGGISFSLSQGERVAMLGESGSGKSMTARAVLGLQPVQAQVTGSIHVNGIEVTGVSALARSAQTRPAMIMQDTLAALNPLVTIGHQLEQPLLRNGRSHTAARAEALTLLAKVGLDDPQIASRSSPELSGGQRQRVCIAIALASQASVIIADEPTSALDVVTQAQILTLLRQVSAAPEGPALLFITHDLHAAAHLCDRALVIRAGQIVEEAPIARILTAPEHDYTRSLIVSAARCGIDCERLYA